MISSAVQDGLYVRAIGTDGSTLYTRKGELLGFTSVSVTVRDGNTIYICGPDGRTQSTRSYQGGRTAYDDLLEQAFIAAAKPFVSLTSVIQQGQASAGHVVVSFSDDNAQVGIYPKEAISGLDLGHYSVIYKIKGSCRVINR